MMPLMTQRRQVPGEMLLPTCGDVSEINNTNLQLLRQT
jgi:hypothetical protein